MRARPNRTKSPKGPPGKRCYAIGDVHGRLDLLTDLFARIEAHAGSEPVRETIIVLLGDLVDRGPNSRQVIDYVRGYRGPGVRLYSLMGNHEELMLRSLEGDVAAFQSWLTNGGLPTIRSYGVDTFKIQGLSLQSFQQRFAAAVPLDHVAFLKSCPDSIGFGDYLFAHAGVRPGRPLEAQLPRDLRWIREAFLSSHADHGFVVVHGHSQRTEIEIRPNRIGIDTGAYHSGVLTAAWFEDGERGFLQTAGAILDTSQDILFG